MTSSYPRHPDTCLRIYDNDGRSQDRYTIIPPHTAKHYKERNGLWEALASDETPFHPRGFGQHTSALPGRHLGKRINWADLPPQAQRFARQNYEEFAPLPATEPNLQTLQLLKHAHNLTGAPGRVTGYFGDGRYAVQLQNGMKYYRFRSIGPLGVTVMPHGFKRASAFVEALPAKGATS